MRHSYDQNEIILPIKLTYQFYYRNIEISQAPLLEKDLSFLFCYGMGIFSLVDYEFGSLFEAIEPGKGSCGLNIHFGNNVSFRMLFLFDDYSVKSL